MTLTLPMLALAAVLGLAGAGQAQPQAQQLRGDALLTDLFVRVVAAYRERNTEPVEEFSGDFRMARDTVEAAEFQLAGGKYAIIGVCDESCSDIDLRVGTAAGEVLGHDVLDDDAPLVKFDAPAGAYRFQIAMQTCAVDKCQARVKVFRVGGLEATAQGESNP